MQSKLANPICIPRKYIQQQTQKNQIHIHDYLNDQNLISQVKNKQKKLVCAYGHLLTSYQSNIRKNHFKHLHNEDLDNYPMTEWHCESARKLSIRSKRNHLCQKGYNV